MTNPGHHHLAEELPHNHFYQITLLLIFLAIWIPDSFFLNISTFFRNDIPFWLHVIIAIAILLIGLYLIERSHSILFKTENTGLVTTGIFGRIRHPMYLGTILIYGAAVIGTLSLLSLIPLLIIIFAYDKMAGYEEKKLEEKLGEEYIEYKRKVPKWIPR